MLRDGGRVRCGRQAACTGPARPGRESSERMSRRAPSRIIRWRGRSLDQGEGGAAGFVANISAGAVRRVHQPRRRGRRNQRRSDGPTSTSACCSTLALPALMFASGGPSDGSESGSWRVLGSKPTQRRTGRVGYRAKPGSVAARPHRRNVEPRAVRISRECRHTPHRPGAGVVTRSSAPYSRGGEGGIRTHEIFRLCAFQERRLQPLGHLSSVREHTSDPAVNLEGRQHQEA